jgi:hypothetical protein
MRRKNKIPYFLAMLEQLVGVPPKARDTPREGMIGDPLQPGDTL